MLSGVLFLVMLMPTVMMPLTVSAEEGAIAAVSPTGSGTVNSTCSDFFGSLNNNTNQTITIDETCKTGADATDVIAKINAGLVVPDISTQGGKLSVRIKLSDNFGFMLILDKSAFAVDPAMVDEYGFCFSTEPFEGIEGTIQVPAKKYLGQDNLVYSTYTWLTAATLDTPIYFSAYAKIGDAICQSEVRVVNCLAIIEELQDGKWGSTTITVSRAEMDLYAAMFKYHELYKAYYDSLGQIAKPEVPEVPEIPEEPEPPVEPPKAVELSEVLESLPELYGKLTKEAATGNQSKVLIFSNATVGDFNAYCEAFKAGWYTEYSKTTFHGGSMSYVGQELYLNSYFDYFDLTFDDNFDAENYFATYISDDYSIDLAFHEYDNLMYMSISPREGLTLPATSEPAYTPVDTEKYPIILTQVGTYEFHKSDAAACYVIRLADGSFIVYDTAFGTYNGQTVAEEIYKVLRKQAPDPNNIVISAFILSHPHLDHMGGFTQFAQKYAGNTGIKVKQVVYNFPDLTFVPNTSGVGNSENLHVTNTNTAIQRFGSSLEVVKPRSGNVLHYPGVKFNVLYTQEDFLSLASNADGLGNALTMVTQMVTGDGTKVIFGGDHWTDKTKGQLKYRYGTFLESYVCTLFHHGIGGGAENTKNENLVIYKMAIKPKIALWPISWAKMSDTGSSNTLYFSDSVWNKYITAGKNSGDGRPGTGGFEEGKIHSTPNKNGVYGWFVADDGIQILTFNDKNNVSVTTYATRAAYYNS